MVSIMEKTISLKFDGYWRDEKRSGVPNKSGVYLVYTCTYDSKTKKVSLKKLIYIGEAKEVRDRIGPDHEKRRDWKDELTSGQQLCFSFAPADKSDRERSEAALIFKKKPVCNDTKKDTFNYDKTTIKSTGEHKYIPNEFTVERTE